MQMYRVPIYRYNAGNSPNSILNGMQFMRNAIDEADIAGGAILLQSS